MNSYTENKIDPRQAFISSMQTLSSQFAESRENVLEREKIFKRVWKDLKDSLAEETITGDHLATDNPLVKAAREADAKVTARLAVWENAVEKYDLNTDFRKDFGDSLLVYVYGKVKAGKSSLGNYIAYGHVDPDKEMISNAKQSGICPEFFMRDAVGGEAIGEKEKELLERRKFSVGSVETTTEIQGFRLPGLTWIDSPGIHSVTPENGKLSKDYADAADLIVYPMNSGQPGRATDLEEIAGLLHTKKPFLVIVSRCDVVEVVDFDDQGKPVKQRLMKTDKDRQDQVNYVRKEILEKAEKLSRELLDPEVVTLSVLFAEENAGNPEKLIESGVADFLNKMKDLAQSDGVNLKKATPLKNLQTFVDRVVDGEESAKSLRDDMGVLTTCIAEQRKSLQRKKIAVIGRVLTELGAAIDDAVSQHSTSRNSAALLKQCSKIIEEIVVRQAAEVMTEVLVDAESAINDSIHFDKFSGVPEFRDLTAEIQISDKQKKKAIFGGLAAVAAGVVGVIWAVPTGGASLALTAEALLTGVAIVTATAAARHVGEKVGEAMASESVITEKVGNNTHEVRMEFNRIAADIAQKSIESLFEDINGAVLVPIEEKGTKIIAALDQFESVLKSEVRPNEV